MDKIKERTPVLPVCALAHFYFSKKPIFFMALSSVRWLTRWARSAPLVQHACK
jgi:hypothetical protein